MNKTYRIMILMSLALVAAGGLRAQTAGSGTSTNTGTTTGTTTGGTTTGGTTTGGTTTGGTTTGGTTTGGTTTGGTTTAPSNGKGNGKANAGSKGPNENASPNAGTKGPSENASANAKAVHAVIAEFQLQRDEWLAKRKELLAKLGTATEAEKAAILEQLRADKAAREDEERSLGKQIREEMKRLREERKSGGTS